MDVGESTETKEAGKEVAEEGTKMDDEEEKSSEPAVADSNMEVENEGEKNENESSTTEEKEEVKKDEPTVVAEESAAANVETNNEAAPTTAAGTEPEDAPITAAGTVSEAAPITAAGTESEDASITAAGTESEDAPITAAGTESEDAPTTATGTESNPNDPAVKKEEINNESTNDLIKKEGDGDGGVKADDTTAISSSAEGTSIIKAEKATEAKKIEPDSSANADDLVAIEPKSELVAAAEEDAKNNKDQPAPCESAVRPNNRDVLFGRGKPFQNHPGNRKMLSYIDQYKRQYNESPRDQKRPIVEEIIGILTSGGGRFLRRYNEDVNSTWWTEVPKQVAFDKVSHAFRSRGRPKASDSAAAKASLAQARAAAAAVAHQGHHPHQQHPHHPQHAYTTSHHQGQYGGVPPPGAQFTGQFGQYGMPPANFNPMIAAMQQQHHHNPMMGYHPMPGGITPQQQAMMQAGMMVAMQQQQQQQHVGGPPGGPPPPYYQQPPPPNPYYGQQQQHHQQPPQPQQEQPNQGQQQQQQPNQAPGQTPASGIPFNMYGQAPAAGGFLIPQQQPQQQQQQPGAPGFAPPGGAQPTPAQGANTGVTPASPPVQGEEMKGKQQVGI